MEEDTTSEILNSPDTAVLLSSASAPGCLEAEGSEPKAGVVEDGTGSEAPHDQAAFSIGKRGTKKVGAKERKKHKNIRFRKWLRDKTDYADCHGDLPEPSMITLSIYLEPRVDVSMGVKRRTDTIHMFGIDLMGTCDIFSYFGNFSPRNIEWINDSSCNVVLGDNDCVTAALTKLGRPIKTSDFPKDDMKNKAFCQTYLWYRARPFLKGMLKEKVHLMLRMATVDDVKPEAESKNTRQLWLKETREAKQLIKKNMLDHDISKLKSQRKKKAEPTMKEQPPKKRKGSKQGKKQCPTEDYMEVVYEPQKEPTVPQADLGPPQASGSSLLPPDLRDFVSKLRAKHGITQ